MFTFHPEASVAPGFPERVVEVVGSHAGEVAFIELTCDEAEIERRVENESRAQHGKLRSLTDYKRLRDGGAFSYPPLPEPLLRVDTGSFSPNEAALQIDTALRSLET